MDDLRAEVLALLVEWRNGLVDAETVRTAAEGWVQAMGESFGAHSASDPLAEVVTQLDVMHLQLITPDDVPAMMTFLESAPENAPKAWRQWNSYWAKVDIRGRADALRGIEFYLPGVRGVLG